MSDRPEDLPALSDEEFVKVTEKYVWLSAFANNNPRSRYHKDVDDCFDEAARRKKPWLYCQGYNRAVRSCGYEPTPSDIAAALPPVEAA
ncbi:hypothetical protein ABLE91_05545 [Aquabacter sp. CN5-332]|uniref:hypothetical protein n=1 Tax=Aquabacter sp. CN5-332 TaxID=3156608 RepID=UPI0032B59FA3